MKKRIISILLAVRVLVLAPAGCIFDVVCIPRRMFRRFRREVE
ncbi:hypothetical protein [uncultured Robinsoniella sp.]